RCIRRLCRFPAPCLPHRIVGLFVRPRRLFDSISPLGALYRQIAVYSLAQYPCDGDIMLACKLPHLRELRFGQNDRCSELFLSKPRPHGTPPPLWYSDSMQNAPLMSLSYLDG